MRPGRPMAERGARLHRNFALYLAGLFAFLAAMAWAERAGLSRQWIGPVFLFATVLLCAPIGIWCRSTESIDYYVAGRRVPAFYNGMAVAADWISAASFISLAGGLYLQGFSGTATQPGGLAYIVGWTGGFCLVALFVAPQLRRLSLYTVPDYFALRFGGEWPRLLAALAAIVVSFTYMVAQIYGVGLIAARLTGVPFELGILLGLGGVLLCSFLGGMRAITWTQVAHYAIMLLAFLLPVSWLAWQQLGNPFAPIAYGQQLPKIAALEQQLIDSPAEQQVRAEFARRARDLQARIADPKPALVAEHAALQQRLRELKRGNGDIAQIVSTSRELATLPTDAATAIERWKAELQQALARAQPLSGLPRHTQAFAGDPHGNVQQRHAFQESRLNFLALIFCLMVGTVGMPHLLTRFYTTPTVQDARRSVAWALLFMGLIYVSAPALAVLVKFEVMHNLVGSRFDALPGWIAQWSRVDGSLLQVSDVNGDGLLQFGELQLGGDLLMLATPEIGGLPYVVSGLVAAGGLAAALSTADALLLTISNALVRDIHSHRRGARLAAGQRVILSKFVLLAVAMIAAAVAALKPTNILSLVAVSFSVSAATIAPVLLLGILWRGLNRIGAVAGMVAGFVVGGGYILLNTSWLQRLLGLTLEPLLWFGIQPVSAGLFGAVAAVLSAVGATALTPHRSGAEP